MIASYPLRVIVFISGWVSLIVGCIGIVLPLLPTTPFILLSAYCFSRSSERLHQWLITHPRMGPLIQDWEQFGSISKTAKIKSSVLIVVFFSASLVFVNVAPGVKTIVSLMGISVLSFIWTRPLPPNEQVLPAIIAVE